MSVFHTMAKASNTTERDEFWNQEFKSLREESDNLFKEVEPLFIAAYGEKLGGRVACLYTKRVIYGPFEMPISYSQEHRLAQWHYENGAPSESTMSDAVKGGIVLVIGSLLVVFFVLTTMGVFS